MFTTLNNETARRVLGHALNGLYRFCAYALYNYRDIAFTPDAYKRLFSYVIEFLGDNWHLMVIDDTIDVCVRSYISSYYEKNF